MTDACDVLIVGAGPAGLCLASALADAGFSSTLLDRQPQQALALPAPDGREIALTHRSVGILQSLGLWQRFDAQEISAIREARVLNGRSPRWLGFDTQTSSEPALGYLLPNHAIRKAAFDAAQLRPQVRLRSGVRIARVQAQADCALVQLADGEQLQAPLLIAADSRLSDTRRQMGIGAQTRDFGRSVIVCHLAHTVPSDDIAYECFGYGRTLALLPLNGERVSAVVTVASDRADALMNLSPAAFAASLQEQFGPQLGELRLLGERHLYPLVAAYADRFVSHRCALVGDAAVGMHPVTAHGFNLGLYGIDTLTQALLTARHRGADIGSLHSLSPYDRAHRRTTLPYYLGTNALVGLFTDDRLPARAARAAALGLARHLPPLKHAISRRLTDAGPQRSPQLTSLAAS